MRRSRLTRKSPQCRKYELAVHNGAVQRIKKVSSIREAKDYLKDKTYHSAELFSATLPHVIVKKFGRRKKKFFWE